MTNPTDAERAPANFNRLSPLEREKFTYDTTQLVGELFKAAHDAVGWSGDMMPECFDAARPIAAQALASARAAGYRQGQEDMRERCAEIVPQRFAGISTGWAETIRSLAITGADNGNVPT